MMTRSQTRIAQLENQVESMTKGMVAGLYQLMREEKELQARIAELEKENEKLSGKYSDLWHYGCNDDLSEVHIVEMLLEKGEKERVMDVWSDVYEENRDHFEFNEDSEDEDEDYKCEECGVQVIAADIPENECRSIAYGSLSMAFCKPCYERSWAEHPENPANKDSDSNDDDEDTDEDTDDEDEQIPPTTPEQTPRSLKARVRNIAKFYPA